MAGMPDFQQLLPTMPTMAAAMRPVPALPAPPVAAPVQTAQAAPAPAAPAQMPWYDRLMTAPGRDLSSAIANAGQGNVSAAIGGGLRSIAGVPGAILGGVVGASADVGNAAVGLGTPIVRGFMNPAEVPTAAPAAPAPPAPTQGVRGPVPPVPAGMMSPQPTAGAPTAGFVAPKGATPAEPITIVRGGRVSSGGGMTNYDVKQLASLMQPRVSPVDAARYQIYGLGVGQMQSGLAQAQKAYREALAQPGADKQKALDVYNAALADVTNKAKMYFQNIGLTPANYLQEIQGMPAAGN